MCEKPSEKEQIYRDLFLLGSKARMTSASASTTRMATIQPIGPDVSGSATVPSIVAGPGISFTPSRAGVAPSRTTIPPSLVLPPSAPSGIVGVPGASGRIPRANSSCAGARSAPCAPFPIFPSSSVTRPSSHCIMTETVGCPPLSPRGASSADAVGVSNNTSIQSESKRASGKDMCPMGRGDCLMPSRFPFLVRGSRPLSVRPDAADAGSHRPTCCRPRRIDLHVTPSIGSNAPFYARLYIRNKIPRKKSKKTQKSLKYYEKMLDKTKRLWYNRPTSAQQAFLLCPAPSVGRVLRTGMHTLPEGGTHIPPRGRNKSKITGGADNYGE